MKPVILTDIEGTTSSISFVRDVLFPYARERLPAFVAGSGLFTLHVGDKVYEVLCEAGDLIAVPDGTTHWFDMGPEPSFVAIRFFTEPDGWVGHFTGTDIAQRFPRYE